MPRVDFCPRKPHPFGNEYHSICCGLSGIMYAVELREGKDAPAQREVDPEEKKIGKTACLLLRLTKALYTTGKVVILGSGFCVLQAIIALQEKGVFSGAWIKKESIGPSGLTVMVLTSTWRAIQLENVTPSESSSMALTMMSFARRSRSM